MKFPKIFRKDRRGESPIKGLILVLLLVVIGASLFTTVYTTSHSAQNATTDTGQKSMLGLLPMIFILLLIVGAFIVLIKSLDVI